MFRKAIRILASLLWSTACSGESQERSVTCDGSEPCVVNEDGTCSQCCCPLRGTGHEFPADLTCKRQVLEGTLECYARAGSSDDFPDLCGSAPVAVCVQRSVGDSLQVRELPSIPLGWQAMSEWGGCSAEAAEAIRSTNLCE